MTKPETRLTTELLLLAMLATLWGSSYLFLKVAVTEIPPVTLIAIRVSIAAVFLLAVITARSERLPRDPLTWRQLLVQSFFNSIGAWVLLAWGQQHVDSALASVLNSTSPIFVFLMTVLFTRHESTSLVRLAGALLGICGVALIIGVDALQGLGQQVAGQVAAVAGAMLYGVAAIYGQRRFGHLSAPVTAAGTMIWATAILVPFSLLLERPWELRPSVEALAAAGMLGLFCTGVALLLYFRLLRTLGSLGTASQAYLRAGIGVGLGMVFLGEEISLTVGFGLIAAILGVAMINLPPGLFSRLFFSRRRLP